MNKITFRSLAFVASVLAPATVGAASVYTQPLFDLRLEHNDNFNLSPTSDPDSDVYGYVADLATVVGIATPRSDTTLRPRVKLQEFPDRDDFERVEGFFDLASHFRGQRGGAHFLAGFSRQDVYNAETPTGDFDPVDPGGGEEPEAGPIIIGETRTRAEIEPSFDYRVSERTQLGGGLYLNSTRYDAEGPETKTDYDYGVVRGTVTWALNPASNFTVGAYTSRYEAADDSRETDAVGALLGYAHRWSERSSMEVRVFQEENDTTVFLPVRVEDSTSNFGGEVVAFYRREISSWRLALGRSFVPTGDNGKSEFDQFRLEYDRQLSQRLGFRGVARYDSRADLGDTGGVFGRDYARVDLSLRWYVTPTWYVGGGYSYIWVDNEQAIDSGDNNKLFINFGYRGLNRFADRTQNRPALRSETVPQ